MNIKSRTQKSFFNIVSSITYQFLNLFLVFLSRTLFINILGKSYLGINSLFSDILVILSLAELGINSAMIFSMYKPLSEKNYIHLSALMNYYKKIYNIIACVVLCLGLLLLPFLSFLVKTDNPIENLHLYYLITLFTSVSSYLFVYRTSIVHADQKAYIIKLYNSLFSIFRFLVQILFLYLFKNYVIYLFVNLFLSIFNNVYLSQKSKKIYTNIFNTNNKLSKKEKNYIWNNVKDMFLYKLGGVILNNTDYVMISSLLSTDLLGVYSNYYMLIKSVSGVISLFFTSIQSSIGNLSVEQNTEKQLFIFKILNLFSFWVYGFCTICFSMLTQDFIYLWLGDEFLLSSSVVIVISVTFYLTGVLYPIWCYRESTGLFKHTKFIMIYASIINIVLSILGAKFFGLEGILGATILARLLTNVWYEPWKLFKILFQKSPSKYFIEQIINFIFLSLLVIILKIFFYFVNFENLYVNFGFKVLFTTVFTNLIFLVLLCRKDEFKFLKSKILNIKNVFK